MMHNVLSLLRRSIFQSTRSLRQYSLPKIDPTESSLEDQAAARQWLANFTPDSIPLKICDIRYSRSSGPGGQKVNKYNDHDHTKMINSLLDWLERTNSKATLRIFLKDLSPIMPKLIHQRLPFSRYYAKRSESLVIQADGSRRQAQNEEECLRKLQDLILETARSAVRGETSPEQAAKVKAL